MQYIKESSEIASYRKYVYFTTIETLEALETRQDIQSFNP